MARKRYRRSRSLGFLGRREIPFWAGSTGPSVAQRGIVRASDPERPNHVWSYDFVQDRTHDGRAFRMLVGLDEFTQRCLAILVARRLGADDVLQYLANLFVVPWPPEHIRSDNDPRVRRATADCSRKPFEIHIMH